MSDATTALAEVLREGLFHLAPTNRKEPEMADTTNFTDYAETLGTMTHASLIRLGAAAEMLLKADAAFKAGDDETGKRYVNNAAAGLGSPSIDSAVYEGLPRGGEPVTGMG